MFALFSPPAASDFLCCGAARQVLRGDQEGELPGAAARQAAVRLRQGDLPAAGPHHLPAAHRHAGQPAALRPQLLHQGHRHQGHLETGQGGHAARRRHLAEHGAGSVPPTRS